MVGSMAEANRINFALMASFPTLLLAYMGISGTKKILSNLTQKNTYQPLRKALRNLHRIFNKYGNSDANMSVMDCGYSYYWVEQFKKHATTFTGNEQVALLDDLADLENPKFHPYQKLAAIQCMYHNYHFLLPTGL